MHRTIDDIFQKYPYAPALAAVLILFLLGALVYVNENEKKQLVKEREKEQEVQAIRDEHIRTAFEALPLSAQAVYVYDAKNDTVLYEKNAEMQLPLASITKLMTALVSSELLSEKTPVSITEEDLRTEGDSGLVAGEQWELGKLISFTLVTSSNDGAQALASAAGAQYRARAADKAAEGKPVEQFVDLMNKVAQELKLTQTYFLNPTGLDTSERVSGGYGSARDVTMLLKTVLSYAPELLEDTSEYADEFYTLNNGSHLGINTNEALTDIPGLIASKTGYTDLAGGNLAIAFDAGINRPIFITVLGSSREDRFADVTRLVETALSTLE